ncbi:hypothetical protein C3L33_14019, partial [Rhododendron williamsianum]
MAPLLSLLCALFLLLNLHASARLVFEEGYTVSTVLDGNKLNVNPHFILPRSDSSDFLVLDSEHKSEIKRLSGNGFGFSDGDLAAALFNKPKSFAVDLKGNVYVADKGNLAIRKISKSGHEDGPGRNASFSPDFELAFIPERCALMICDHGHKLVRQINLKSEDCPEVRILDVILHAKLGAQAKMYSLFVFSKDVSHAAIRILSLEDMIKSALAYLVPDYLPLPMSLKHLCLCTWILEHQKQRDTKSQMYDEQLKDLMTFDGVVEPPESADKIFEQGDDNGNRNHVMSEGHQSVDCMIYANIRGFEEQGKGVPGKPW